MSCSEWKYTKLSNYIKVKHGYAFKGAYITPEKGNNVLLTPGNFKIGGGLKFTKNKYFTGEIPEEYILKEGDLVVTMTDLSKLGDTLGYSGIIPAHSNLTKILHNQRIGLVSIKSNDIDKNFLHWRLRSYDYQQYIVAHSTGSTVKHTAPKTIENFEFILPSLPEQERIAGVLSALDDKIENNNAINKKLEEMAQAIFKSYFIDFTRFNGSMPNDWQEGAISNYFDISIGKTPPRKEPQWFSEDPNNATWVSISDMGKSGLYISKSAEYLKRESIEKFNVKIVPDNTVLLSFKLTVGRVVISDGEMATNEAIAHFVTKNKEIVEYLYLYLKNFNFQTMGSTSSIATAVNSKIIKSMNFYLPSENIIKSFHEEIKSSFLTIKNNLKENEKLTQLRDSLLPKLMSGKLKI